MRSKRFLRSACNLKSIPIILKITLESVLTRCMHVSVSDWRCLGRVPILGDGKSWKFVFTLSLGGVSQTVTLLISALPCNHVAENLSHQ